jgi:hypothetical protein
MQGNDWVSIKLWVEWTIAPAIFGMAPSAVLNIDRFPRLNQFLWAGFTGSHQQ